MRALAFILLASCSSPSVPAWLRDPKGPIVPTYFDPTERSENQRYGAARPADAGAADARP